MNSNSFVSWKHLQVYKVEIKEEKLLVLFKHNMFRLLLFSHLLDIIHMLFLLTLNQIQLIYVFSLSIKLVFVFLIGQIGQSCPPYFSLQLVGLLFFFTHIFCLTVFYMEYNNFLNLFYVPSWGNVCFIMYIFLYTFWNKFFHTFNNYNFVHVFITFTIFYWIKYFLSHISFVSIICILKE